MGIETAAKDANDPNPKANLDPRTGKIISIQFQQLDSRSGMPLSDLTILKEWESSERDIVSAFSKLFVTDNHFGFIPVGFNLPFEFRFLCHKFAEFGNPVDPFQLVHDRPWLDLKPIFVILNEGNFRGCGLDKFSNKKNEGHLVGPRYRDKEYYELEAYIRQEADEFVRAYQILKSQLPASVLPHLRPRHIKT